MGNPAGVRRGFTALEKRRMHAARLLEKGYSQSEVARRVGAHRQSVSKWAAELDAKGRVGLKKAGRAGRKPRLSAEDLGRIEQECGVSYHPSQAWRILRQLGWSCQRPTGRALERNEEKIRRWKQKRWPKLKKRPKTKAAPSSSSTRAD